MVVVLPCTEGESPGNTEEQRVSGIIPINMVAVYDEEGNTSDHVSLPAAPGASPRFFAADFGADPVSQNRTGRGRVEEELKMVSERALCRMTQL